MSRCYPKIEAAQPTPPLAITGTLSRMEAAAAKSAPGLSNVELVVLALEKRGVAALTCNLKRDMVAHRRETDVNSQTHLDNEHR